MFSNPDSGDTNQPMPDTSNVPTFDYAEITEKEIISAINEIKLDSAPGPDKIPAVLIKECKHEIAPALKILWQKSIDQGQIPSQPSGSQELATETSLIYLLKRISVTYSSMFSEQTAPNGIYDIPIWFQIFMEMIQAKYNIGQAI